MTKADKAKAIMIAAVMKQCVERLQDEVGMEEAAAFRALIFAGLHGLPQVECGGCLHHDLTRFRNWLDHDLKELSAAGHAPPAQVHH